MGQRTTIAFIRRAMLLHLFDHRVEPHDAEWFARCRINQAASFPIALYDIMRTAMLVLLVLPFAPPWALLLILLQGGAFAAWQFRFNRACTVRIAMRWEEGLRMLRCIIVSRGIVWAGLTVAALSAAPPGLLVPLAMLFLASFWAEAIGSLALPAVATGDAALKLGAVLVPLGTRGLVDPLVLGALAVFIMLFTYWAIANLYYLFATRRLRTRVLGHANDTIQLLLNQYDEDGSDWLIECDATGRILRPSRRFCTAAGRSRDTLEGMRLSHLFDDSAERDELVAIGDREEAFRNFIIRLTVAGETLCWSLTGRPIYAPDGTLKNWRGFAADVTRSSRAEARITYLAHYDELTDLPNRSLFNTTLQRAFDRRDDRLLAVLYVDLDRFKAINDSHGHAIGDRVLGVAGRRIAAAVPAGAMVSRLGGDEFAILFDAGTHDDALRAAQAIVSAMDDPVTIDGQAYPTGACVGIAFAPDNGDTADAVLRAADLALYDAKARGRRGASVFDPAMQQEVQERRAIELDLRGALARDELELRYQPLVDIRTTDIVGYEALLRWHHPERGSISPAVFVPIAEDSGQIVAIGAWVLREALHECARWPGHLSVSVNLSPAQIRDPALFALIVGALASSGVAPHRLELEITETLLMEDNLETIALLHTIRDLGVTIALDDFGTGYSSLNYLRSFPFDKIKIDRCFVEDIANRPDSVAIINAVVALATKLNMRTTAEGVECEEQLQRLRATGCALVQGFLFSEARPAAELDHCTLAQRLAG